MTANNVTPVYNDAAINAIAKSDFYKTNVSEMFYIPQESSNDDIEVFLKLNAEARVSYESLNEFSDIINHAVNYKGEKGYFFIHLNLLDAADEDVMREFEERKGEIVKYE